MENIAVEYRYDLLGRAVPVSHHCAPARHVDATLCAPCLRAAEHRHPGRVLGAVLVVTALRILYIALSPSPHGPVTAAALCALSTLSFIRVMRPSLVARICGRTRTVVYVRDDAAADTGVGDDGPSLATVRLALTGYSAAALCGAVPSLTGAHTETGRAPALTDS